MAGPERAAEPPIDRIAPARRPAGRPAGCQRWRSLLFLHWPVPAVVLRPLVPPGLAIDLYDGLGYVGLTPFLVRGARPAGVPEALSLDFLEANVRTYVRVDGREPGVYFFSLDAASLIAVLGARLGLGLPYFPARMRARRRGGCPAVGRAWRSATRSASRSGPRGPARCGTSCWSATSCTSSGGAGCGPSGSITARTRSGGRASSGSATSSSPPMASRSRPGCRRWRTTPPAWTSRCSRRACASPDAPPNRAAARARTTGPAHVAERPAQPRSWRPYDGLIRQ